MKINESSSEAISRATQLQITRQERTSQCRHQPEIPSPLFITKGRQQFKESTREREREREIENIDSFFKPSRLSHKSRLGAMYRKREKGKNKSTAIQPCVCCTAIRSEAINR